MDAKLQPPSGRGSDQDQWFLEGEGQGEVRGQRSGPFTFEQLQGFFHEKQILPTQKVTSPLIHHQWITIQELMDRHRAHQASRAPTAAVHSGPFVPPPRPAGVEEHAHDPNLLPDGKSLSNDPMLSLFDALQAARDRKQAKVAPPQQARTSSDQATWKGLPVQAWYVIAVGAMLAVGIGGWIRLMNEVPKDSTPTAESRRAVAPTAPAMATPGNGGGHSLSTALRPSAPRPRAVAPAAVSRNAAQEDRGEREAQERDRERENELERERHGREDEQPPRERMADPERYRERLRDRERTQDTDLSALSRLSPDAGGGGVDLDAGVGSPTGSEDVSINGGGPNHVRERQEGSAAAGDDAAAQNPSGEGL